MKGNALKHAMEDVVVGCASAAIVGRAVGAVVSGLNAGSDYANGKIKQEEAVKQMKAGTAAGAIAGSATKFVDTGCQAAAKTLAAEGSLAGAACSRNAVPVAAAAVGVISAGKAVYDACQDGAGEEETKEAKAQVIEVTAGVASTVAIVALEASGPVGWGILGVGLLAGWVIRKLM